MGASEYKQQVKDTFFSAQKPQVEAVEKLVAPIKYTDRKVEYTQIARENGRKAAEDLINSDRFKAFKDTYKLNDEQVKVIKDNLAGNLSIIFYVQGPHIGAKTVESMFASLSKITEDSQFASAISGGGELSKSLSTNTVYKGTTYHNNYVSKMLLEHGQGVPIEAPKPVLSEEKVVKTTTKVEVRVSDQQKAAVEKLNTAIQKMDKNLGAKAEVVNGSIVFSIGPDLGPSRYSKTLGPNEIPSFKLTQTSIMDKSLDIIFQEEERRIASLRLIQNTPNQEAILFKPGS